MKWPKNSQRFVPRRIRIPENRVGSAYGKPDFPEISYSTELVDLIDRDSAFFFTSLNIKTEFLSEPPADWPLIPVYIDGLAKVKSLHVTNDIAERAVHTASMFLKTAKKEEHFQNNLQVATENRKGLPNLRCKKTDVSKWCS